MAWAQITALWLGTWRDRWHSLVGWALGMVALVAVMMAVYPSIRSTSGNLEAYIAAMPEAFRAMFRLSDYSSGAGYLSAELFSFMLPMVFIGLGIAWGSGATALEEERGTADLLLTLPVSRERVLLSKLGALLTAVLGLGVLLWVSLMVGGWAIDLTVGAGELLAVCLTTVLLGWLFAAVGLLAGALTGRRGIAAGVAIGLALAGFLLYSLGPLSDSLTTAMKLTPFQWAYGNDPIRTGLDAGYLALLLGLTVVLCAASVVAFRRRDVGT